MDLQSARDLKSLLRETVLTPLTSAPKIATFALAAGPLDAGPVRSLALGIARRTKTDFQLAVRCQRPELMDSKEVAQIQSPKANYKGAARFLIEQLGVDTARFETAFERDLYPSLKLSRGVFFPRPAPDSD